MPLKCSITTPERLVFQGDAEMVVVPASDGELGILSKHAPLMALLGTGELRLKTAGGKPESYFLSGGFVQVLHDHVHVLATEAEKAAEIDAAAAAAERDRLESEPESQLPPEERELHRERLRAARIRARLASGRRSKEN